MLRGFTLVELLVVIVIIVILAGLVVPAVSAIQRRNQTQKTEQLLMTIDATLHTFKADFQDYPRKHSAEAEVGNYLVYRLCSDMTGVATPGDTDAWQADYLDSEIPSDYRDGMQVTAPSEAGMVPLVYIYNPQVREDPNRYGSRLIGGRVATDPETSSPFTTCYPGYENEFELWSPGYDGIFGSTRNDPAFADNVTMTKYRAD